ncbi:MAG: hypothetical protein ACRC48_16160 [Aeromonas veronii]
MKSTEFSKKKSQSAFVKAAEAVLIAKLIKLISAKPEELSKYDQRSPALMFAKAVKKTIGAVGGDKVGKAYLAFNTIKALKLDMKPVMKECEQEHEDMPDAFKAVLALLDESLIDPKDSDLIPLINESQGSSKYRVLHAANRKTFLKELLDE